MADPIFDIQHLGAAIAAVGALGIAATGLVDGFKSLPGGGLSNAGFDKFIEAELKPFFDAKSRKESSGGVRRAWDTLHGNWINGTALADQKAIAKTLIKARLDKSNAEGFATLIDAAVVPADLASAADKMNGVGTNLSLTAQEQNALGRFDLALTSLLDAAYQHADQRYRNTAKIAAAGVAVVLAVVGGLSLGAGTPTDFVQWVLAGLLATPLAPMAKDLASALQAGANAARSLKR